MEAAGVVEAVGSGVSDFAVGDRVVYTGLIGAYAEQRLVPAARLLKLPDAIPFDQAAAMMLKGLTACYLLTRTYRVAPGDTVLIHAAAGGVGQIAVQWAKALGATVIGTVGSPAKAALAEALGCDHVILYNEEDFVTRVKTITDGAGVNVVYDSVGQATFLKSLDCLKPFGTVVVVGQTSGPIPPIDLVLLTQKGSINIARPTIAHHIASREALEVLSSALFDVVARGVVKVTVSDRMLRD